MFVRLIEPSKSYVGPINVCTDTCNVHVSVPMGDKYLASLLRKLATLSNTRAVIGFDGMKFELSEKEDRLELSITGDSTKMKICKVVF